MVKTFPRGGRCPEGADEERRRLLTWNAVEYESTAFQIAPFYELHLLSAHFAVPHQSDLTVCQLVNYGMIATGNHFHLDSLRGAPPPGEAMGVATCNVTERYPMVFRLHKTCARIVSGDSPPNVKE
ncbi:MAG: hypothetical protein MR762_07040 [Clostridiales bacterium]|nr:hypothetical protein [Clostridiales bacterium]MDD5883475.1 hypothetical protein [Bacillota bacterium]